MAKEPRPKGYPKLKNYKPSQFMLPTSHYDKKKADRAVTFIENLQLVSYEEIMGIGDYEEVATM